MNRWTIVLVPLIAGLLAGGSTPPGSQTVVGKRQVVGTSDVTNIDEVTALSDAVAALGPNVSHEEAARLARVTYSYTAELVQVYQITDPPLVHNTKVNMGIKPRGLCKDWADDIEARLRQEGFQTLDLHRAIANASNFRIEHSTVIVSAKGDDMFDGIVLDPWRFGGVLYWEATTQDAKYDWVPRAEVFAMKRRRAESEARLGGKIN